MFTFRANIKKKSNKQLFLSAVNCTLHGNLAEVTVLGIFLFLVQFPQNFNFPKISISPKFYFLPKFQFPPNFIFPKVSIFPKFQYSQNFNISQCMRQSGFSFLARLASRRRVSPPHTDRRGKKKKRRIIYGGGDWEMEILSFKLWSRRDSS